MIFQETSIYVACIGYISQQEPEAHLLRTIYAIVGAFQMHHLNWDTPSGRSHVPDEKQHRDVEVHVQGSS